MLSFRTMLSAERAGDLRATIGFRLGAEVFLGRLEQGVIAIRREDPAGADLIFESDPMNLASVVYGGRPIADAEAAGALAITGDRALAERYVTLFPLPEKTG
jgi:hypothetical protein